MADFELVTACGHLKGSVNELCGLIDGTEDSFWADEQKPTVSDKAMLVVSKKLGVVEEYFFKVRWEAFKAQELRNEIAAIERCDRCIEAMDSAIQELVFAERTVQEQLDRTVMVLTTVRTEMEALHCEAIERGKVTRHVTGLRITESEDESCNGTRKRARVADDSNSISVSTVDTESAVGSEDTE